MSAIKVSTALGQDIAKFKGEYPSESCKPTKAQAEESAAKACFHGEFPEHTGADFDASPPGGEFNYDSLNFATKSWKTLLNQAVQQRYKEPVTRQSLSYAMAQEEDGFVATIACDKLGAQYATSAPAATKKQAEENAAMNAVRHEFPEVFDVAPDDMKEAGADLERHGPDSQDHGPDHNNDPKSKLDRGIKVLTDGTIKKGDITYSVEQVSENSVQGTVRVACLEGGPREFVGEVVQGAGKGEKKQEDPTRHYRSRRIGQRR